MGSRALRNILRQWKKQTTFLASLEVPNTSASVANFHGAGVVNRKARIGTSVSQPTDAASHVGTSGNNVQPAQGSEGKPRLVIFDKNGTLIDFHRTWTPWVANLTKRLEGMTGLHLEPRVFKTLDICLFTKKTRSGLLAGGTTSQIKRHLEDLLQDIGYPRRRAQLIVERCWQDCDTSDPDTLKEMGNLREMFQDLKKQGIKIAVLTTDNRKSTERTLSNLNLEPYTDMLVCGDDHMGPNADSKVTYICKQLGVPPSDAVMVGDTEDDVKMAQEAEVGRTIGVLSGIGTRLDLSHYADHVVDDVREAVTIITQADPQVRSKVKDQQAAIKQKVSLVIFDKDGTLICFNSIWTPWARSLVERLETVSGLSIADKVLTELGYSHSSERWRPGIFAEGTSVQAQLCVQEVLQKEGLSAAEAKEVVDKVWEHGDHSNSNKDLKLLEDLTKLFKVLHHHGIKIAVCTADSRTSTEQLLRSQNAEQYVDMLVCGDDPDNVPKPEAHNAVRICEALGVDPERTVVVGDTVADLGMGRKAKLGATVAVLSGVGDVYDLDAQADIILPSIKDLLPLIIPQPKTVY